MSGRSPYLRILSGDSANSSHWGVFIRDFFNFGNGRGVSLIVVVVVVGVDLAFDSRVSMFSAAEAWVIIDAVLFFFRGKFSSLDSIYIHGVGVFFLGNLLVKGWVSCLVTLEGDGSISPLSSNRVCPFPSEFKM